MKKKQISPKARTQRSLNVCVRKTFIVIVFFSAFKLYSQEVCVRDAKVEVDPNTIEKCEVKTDMREQQAIVVSVRRRLKRRVYLKEIIHLTSNLKSKNNIDLKVDNTINNRLVLGIRKENVSNKKISFDSVEEIPTFKICENSTLSKVDCFNHKMQEHIVTNFNYPIKALEQGIEDRLEVSFVIDKTGDVKEVKIKGKEIALIKEAQRIVSLLPNFNPGKEKGVTVPVSYTFPMNFTLE